MRNVKLVLEYDGTNYEGWQSQPHRKTLQDTIESALARILRQPAQLNAAGRTDAGVHAFGQVANFRTDSDFPIDRLRWSLNAVLPPDIVCVQAEEAAAGFDARRQALARTYGYYVLNRPYPSAFFGRFSWWVARPLDSDAIGRAAADLVGRHDFAAFTVGKEPSTVRTVTDVGFGPVPEVTVGMWKLTLTAHAFLHHMVRLIMGTLVEVGLGNLSPDGFAEILAAKDVRRAGPRAPARGLVLERVEY